MGNQEEFVSIILPLYNQRHLLKKCIDSVLQQTYKNYELIVVDDCSEDMTLDYLNECYGNIETVEIVYLCNDSHLGRSASENIGISYAKGEYIAFLDANSIWEPEKLEKQMAVMANADESVCAVYGIVEYYHDSDKKYVPSENLNIVYKQGNVYPFLCLQQMIGFPSLLVRKETVYQTGGLNERLRALEEYDFMIRIAQSGYFCFIDEVLAVSCEEVLNAEEKRDRIVTQYYLMDLYKKDLSKFGMKKRKFESVYSEAVSYGQMEAFFAYIMKLSEDDEYKQYVQEKIAQLNPSSCPELIQTRDISGVMDCTGCMACYNICPTGAIGIGTNKEGFLIPVIDVQKCISCGKCKKICPVCNEVSDMGTLLPEQCYAVMADSEMRRKSSSGGVFGVLAENIVTSGGYVAGAVWDDKNQVIHIVSKDMEDIKRMQSSKYVQSNPGTVYKEVQALLEAGEKVLFSGCGCQIVGLRRFLQKEYEKLILVEIVCHGVSSQKVLKASINRWDMVDRISFRDKEIFGWSPGLFVQYKDGTEYQGKQDSPYLFGFLNNWSLRKSCYQCKFKSKKYGDILLGDFWCINNIYSFDDGMGTSFVTVNTVKGAQVFHSVIDQFAKKAALPTAAEVTFNPCINASVLMPKCRELFFEELDKQANMELAIHSVQNRIHFDIALVVMWGANYGNALTNYALYHYLKGKGKNIVMLDNCYTLKPTGKFKEFAEENYQLSSLYFPAYHYDMINQCCDTFLVGSDQNWNYSYAAYFKYWNYFHLDFVKDERKKVSYATSFGRPEAAIPEEMGRILYKRFDAISVREDFGVDLCEEGYGVSAQRVLDPVFLLEQEDYERLIEKASIQETEPYILAYILNPTKKKRKLCKEIQRSMGGIKLINMIDANTGNADYNRMILEYENIRAELSVEEWLYYLRHSEFVITDSYHGTCFSIIFQKNFVSVKARESDRFDTFLLFHGIEDRILEEKAEYDLNQLLLPIDYGMVAGSLQSEKENSKNFIQKYIL